MAELTKDILLKDLGLADGESTLSATSLTTGLDESTTSNSVVYTTDMLEYELNGSLYTLKGIKAAYKDSLTSITVPDYYKGYPVRKIASEAFAGNTVLTHATLPYTVKEIGDSAFANSALSNININSPSYIAIYFRNNCGWTDVRCCSYSDTVGDDTFPGAAMGNVDNDGVADIYTVTVPTGMDRIVFSGLNANGERVQTQEITKENIVYGRCWEMNTQSGQAQVHYAYNASCLILGRGVFSGCSGLGRISLSRAIRDIPADTFKDCTFLSNVIYAVGMNLNSIGESAFENTAIETIENLPNTVTVIGKRAFAECMKLEGIHIPIGVKIIEESAFSNCANVQELYIDSATPLESIGDNAFRGCSSLVVVQNLPATLNSIGGSAFSYCNLYNVVFDNPYGWFEDGEDADNALTNVVASLGKLSNRMYKIDQMIAPTISIDATHLHITDSTGIAEKFNIFVNGKHAWTYNVENGDLTRRT